MCYLNIIIVKCTTSKYFHHCIFYFVLLEIDISLEDLAHRNSNVQLEEQLSCKKDDSLISFKKNSKDCCRTGLNRKEGLTYIPKERLQ